MLHGAHSVSLPGGVVVMGCGTNSEVMGSIHTCFSLKVKKKKLYVPVPYPYLSPNITALIRKKVDKFVQAFLV